MKKVEEGTATTTAPKTTSATTTSMTSTTTTPPPSTTTIVLATKAAPSPSKVEKHELASTDVLFSNIPNQPTPFVSVKEEVVKVKMFKDEPCIIGAYSKTANDVFVDIEKEIVLESGGTGHEAFASIRPRLDVGAEQNMTIYLTNADKSVITPVNVTAEIVQSTNSKLANLIVSPGRLEPAFSPDVFDYKLRVPEKASKVSLKFATVNDRDATCTVDGSNFFTSKGKVSFKVPQTFEEDAITLETFGADKSESSKYTFDLVPQKGGETYLNDVSAMGAPLTTPFNSKKHGVYKADMIRGAALDETQQVPWTQLKIAKPNKNAIVTIDGVPVDEDGNSPFLRVPRGEKRTVKVAVTTPENPVAEEYVVDLSRKKGKSAPWDTASGTRNIGNIFGAASILGGSGSAGSLMQSMKSCQLASTLGHQQGNPEGWNDFATGLNWVSFQPDPCGQLTVGFAEKNQTSYSACNKDRIMASTAAFNSRFASDWSDMRHASAAHELDANLFAVESADAIFELIAGRWVETFDDSALGVDAGAYDFSAGMRRRLTALSSSDRTALSSELENARKTQENMTFYLTTLLVVSAIMAAAALIYGVIWASYLRDTTHTDTAEVSQSHSLGSLEKTENGNSMTRIRADYPTILHPARFLTFWLDLAFIGFASAALGLLFAQIEMFCSIKLMGIDIPISVIRPLATLILLGCLCFLIFGSIALSQISSHMVYGRQFCEYHDSQMTHGKATYIPKWCAHIPWINRLATIEINSITPIRSVASPESSVVTFEDDVDAPVMSTPNGYLKMSQSSEMNEEGGPAYNGDLKAVQVAMNELVYNDSVLNYDGRNAEMYKKYPSAHVGSTTFSLQNAYGYPLTLKADIQAQHLTALMQLMDNFVFWLPRKNCQLTSADSYKNLLVHAGRGLYFDWTINRTLLFFMLAITAYLQTTSSGLGVLVIAGFSFAAALIRLPSYLSTGQAKFARDSALWQLEEKVRQENEMEAREAEQIWPFSEAGFSERFHQVKQKKNARRYCGMYGLCGALNMSKSPAFRSKGWYMAKEVLFTSIMGDLLIAAAALMLHLGNSAMAQPLASAGVAAVLLIGLSLLLLNVRSLFSLFKMVGHCLNDTLDGFVFSCIAVYNFLFTGSIGQRITHFFAQVIKLVTFDPTCNFHFPTAGLSIRRFPVDKVDIVSNELGIQFPAEVGPSTKHLELTVPDRNRLRMYKTLVMNGGIGESRRSLYKSLPVQVPFYQLFKYDGSPVLNTKDSINRLVATIQVVNHTYRANAAGLSSLDTDEHDSFLSLYANDDFLPAPGKVKLRKDGHTYSVRYDAENHSLVVRGPSVVANRHYTLKTSKHQPKAKEEYVNAQNPRLSVSEDSSMTDPSSSHGSAQAICDTPGSIRVEVRSSLRPDIHKEIHVRCPDGSQHSIDPTQIKIHYDPICQEMYLRSQDLQPSNDPYTISWTVAPSSPPQVDTSATARDNGCVIFQLKGDSCPDLQMWMALRDENGAVIDIDPKQTDAYQFYFPEKSQNVVSTAISRLSSVFSFISGSDNGAGAMEEPVPCTIIQCINPVEKIYRVDPNFHEQYRVLNARIHELRARQTACENSDVLHLLWQTLMRPQEYATFWAKNGVDVMDAYGNLMDPLNQTQSLPQYHSLFKEIAHGEANLRRALSAILENRILDLQTQMDKLRVWIRAYNDPALHTSQLEKDLADWSMRPDAEIDGQNAQLRSQKAQYEAAADKFVYPCNVPDVLIAKRPNISNQFRVWTDIVRSWLLFEEGTDISSPEGRLRVSSILKDIIQSLKLTLMSNEVRSLNSYRSVLHYVVGSQTLRGLNTDWRPDAMKAHPALVRVWTEKEGTKLADFQKYPSWFPCLLRLTPNAVQMLLPNGDDLVRACPDSDNPWQRTTGVYIPLHAFQKFDLQHDVPLPPNEENSKFLETMDVKLICRKNQNVFVDDAYVRRMEDVQIGNEICFSDNGVPARYRVMLGHTVRASEAHHYPQAEVDPTIGGDEVNVYPLGFRMNPGYAAQWERAIKMAGLDKPHGYDFDGHIEDSEDSSRPPTPEAVPIELPSSTSSSSPSSSSEPPAIIIPPSVHSSEVTIPSNPESVTLFRGGFSRGAFEGTGCLRDEAGRAVFEGTFVDGRREGRGMATFQSHFFTWQYDGEFDDDEMDGEALITIADSTQLADVREKFSLISFSGRVPPPSSRIAPDSMSQDALDELCSRTKRRPLFAASKSRFNPESARRVEALVRAVYTRPDGPHFCVQADRFAYSDVLLDEPLLKAAKDTSGPQAQFLKQFLPQMTRWQDKNALARATESEGGLWRYVDGSVWEGSTSKDLRPEGKGHFFNWPNQIKFQGTLVNCKPHGQGMLEVGDGAEATSNCYYGSFENGRRVGDATVTAKGVYVKGKFAEDLFVWDYQGNDKCLVVLDSSFARDRGLAFSRYEGQMARGSPHGKGRITFGSGIVYDGNLSEGRRHGKGKLINPNGDVLFEGMFKDDVPEGLCTYYSLGDGLIFCGDMVNGKRSGYGVLGRKTDDKNQKKVVYEGAWKEDVPHGRGYYETKEGDYEGEWINGKRHGKGRFRFYEHPLPNGNNRVYEGDWADDKPHGIGKYLSDNAAENVYRLEKGEIVSSSVNEYAPTCGKGPDIQQKPTVASSGFSRSSNPDAPWKGKIIGTDKLAAIVSEATEVNGWQVYENNTVFIDPTKQVPLQLVRPAPQPPSE